MSNNTRSSSGPRPAWIPLSTSAAFMFSKRVLLGWSALLVLLTIVLTWLGFLLTTGLIDQATGSFLHAEPLRDSIWGWIKYGGWVSGKYLFLLVSRIVAFFLAFLVAYSLTTPFYGFLSSAVERFYYGSEFEDDGGFTVAGIVKDIFEGAKIALFGLLITAVALPLSFVPIVGQVGVFLLYTYYSALMFIDYPASRRRWRLGEKLAWIRRYNAHSIRLGLLPAAITMIPFLNMFLMALIFPVLTVHATLNFAIAERSASPRRSPQRRFEP